MPHQRHHNNRQNHPVHRLVRTRADTVAITTVLLVAATADGHGTGDGRVGMQISTLTLLAQVTELLCLIQGAVSLPAQLRHRVRETRVSGARGPQTVDLEWEPVRQDRCRKG